MKISLLFQKVEIIHLLKILFLLYQVSKNRHYLFYFRLIRYPRARLADLEFLVQEFYESMNYDVYVSTLISDIKSRLDIM